MTGQSAESIAVTRNIVQLKDAISTNKTVFNNIMLGSVQEGLIEQDLLNDFTTSDHPLSSKAVQFINSIQEVLKYESSYLDKLLTVLVKYGDTSCKEVATKIANDYNYSHQLLPNYKQAIIDKRNTTSIKMISEDDETDDTRSFFQLLLEAKDILIVLLRRLKKSVNSIIEKYRSRLFFSICIFLLYVFRLPGDIIYPYAFLFQVCTAVQEMHIKEMVAFTWIFCAGVTILDSNNPTDVQKTPKISRTVIGGQPDSIIWLEEGFKMDIFADSFAPDVPVNITISIHQSSHSKFQLATQMYTITSTSPSSGIVLVHLKHNLALNDTNMNRFLLLFKHTTNYQAKVLNLHNLSRDFLTSQIQIKTAYNHVCGMFNYTALTNKTYPQVYRISFYKKEGIIDYMSIVAVVTFPGDKSIDSKYSRWKKVSKSPYEVSVVNGSNITVKSIGCWNKLESETQTITKGEYSFKMEWKCLWWPIDTFITVDNSNSGINVSISTNAESGYNLIVSLKNSFIGQWREFFNDFLITVVLAYFLSWFYFRDMSVTKMCICSIIATLYGGFLTNSYKFFYYRCNKNHMVAIIFCSCFYFGIRIIYGIIQ